jgi:antitoxin ParD1/3/4
MPALEINLSDDNREFINQQVTAGHFSGPSDYIGLLVEAARIKSLREHIDAQLIEGLESGPPIEVTAEYWGKKREEWSRRYDRADRP